MANDGQGHSGSYFGLKKTNPEAARRLRKRITAGKPTKRFPTVHDARQAESTSTALGGQEGITQLQEEVQDYRTEVEQFFKWRP